MIAFRLIIKYMYLKTQECQDVTLPEQYLFSFLFSIKETDRGGIIRVVFRGISLNKDGLLCTLS